MPHPFPTDRPDPPGARPQGGAEDALRKWEHIFQHARWGIAVTEGDSGRLDWVNRAYAEMHGNTVEELQGRPIIDVFAPEHREEVAEHVRKVLETGHYVFESVHIRKDGSRFPVQVDASVVRDADGRLLCRAAHVQDISERRRAEEALRESEAQARDRLAELEHVYATTPIGIALHDTDLRILRISERLAALDGLPVAEHIGRTVHEVLPDVARVVEPVIRQVIMTGEPVLDVELETSTRALRWMAALVSFHPLKSPDGTVRAVSVGVQDISAQKRAEQALRESEDRLSRILESAMDAIVTFDEHRRITLFNAAAEDVFRCKARDAVGQLLDERFASPALRGALDGCIRAFNRTSVKKR